MVDLRENKIKVIKDIFISLMIIAKRHFAQRLQPHSLTHAQFITLVALSAHQEPCTMSDLTFATLQDAPTMTGIVDRLIKINLVERTRSEIDRRVVLVQPSMEGMALVKKIEEEFLQDALVGFLTLTNEDLERIEQLLMCLMRTYSQRHLPLEDSNLEETIEKFKVFSSDPIAYAKLLNGKDDDYGENEELNP